MGGVIFYNHMAKTKTPKTKSEQKKTLNYSAIEERIAKEIDFARKVKKGRIQHWHANEDLFYGKKKQYEDQRANIGIENTKALGFVDTLLSKIDNPPKIRFKKGAEEDLKKAQHANAMFEKDSKPTVGNWAMKDLVGKKQAIMYGRTIFQYSASSKDGKYKSNLKVIDAYNFLIDPSAGGIEIENAHYLGHTGIYKTKEDLEAGVTAGKYRKEAVDNIIAGGGGETGDEEEKAGENRFLTLVNTTERVLHAEGMFKLWEWYTHIDGERYYILYSEQHKQIVRAVPMGEMFESELYPYATWATYPDLVEFWTPSSMDMVRSIFIGQGESINQLMDNAERINHPMKAVQADAMKNIALLKYRRNRIVKMNRGIDPNTAVRVFETRSIDTPAKVYEILEGIANVESGVSAASRGVAEEDKVGIYQGNLANVADRLGLLNKSYADAYQRLGLLYYHGLIEHLNEKSAIEIIGNDGIEYREITKADIKPDKHVFDVVVETSDAEMQSDLEDKKNKITYLGTLKGNQGVNQQALIELEARIVGLDTNDIKLLLDREEYGDAELMSEAARDIQRIVADKEFDIEPNERATNKYRQKILDYMRENREHLDSETYVALGVYMQRLRPIVTRNTVQRVMEQKAKQGLLQEAMGVQVGQQDGQQAPQGSPQQLPPENNSQNLEELV